MSDTHTMIQRPISWCVSKEGEPIFGETGYTVTIVDEGGGEFIQIEDKDGKISFNPDEWPFIKKAIETAINEVKP